MRPQPATNYVGQFSGLRFWGPSYNTCVTEDLALMLNNDYKWVLNQAYLRFEHTSGTLLIYTTFWESVFLLGFCLLLPLVAVWVMTLLPLSLVLYLIKCVPWCDENAVDRLFDNYLLDSTKLGPGDILCTFIISLLASMMLPYWICTVFITFIRWFSWRHARKFAYKYWLKSISPP